MTVIDTHNPEKLADAAVAAEASRPFGLIGEFDNVTDIIAAANAAREHGFKKMDVHSPFPVHGIDPAIGIKPTVLPWIVLAMGLTGMAAGLLLTTYTMADWIPIPGAAPENFEGYQFLISGKPLNSLAAYIPVVFELTIMFSAYTAVFAMFLLNKLPMLHNPLLKSERFRRATSDRFFLMLDARDRLYDGEKTVAFVKDMPGCRAVEVVDV